MAGAGGDYPGRLGDPVADEAALMPALSACLSGLSIDSIRARALALVQGARDRSGGQLFDMQAFLQAFPISEPIGVNLLRLAEALPRTEDDSNQLALLADKLAAAQAGDTVASPSDGLFERGARTLLRVAGQALPDADRIASGDADAGALAQLVVKPAARRTVSRLGSQFVYGEAIGQAIALAARERGPRVRFSFDMLGEGARTWADADANFERYRDALQATAATARAPHFAANDGVSIKISAIHPRYELAHYPRERERLLDRLRVLCEIAAAGNLNLTIDAEESDRLEMQLDLFGHLAAGIAPASWPGLGIAIQGYQLRALRLVEVLLEIARARIAAGGAPLAVRLVKGAYWDAEIKRAQELGLAGYPVFTVKAHTDRSYLACASRLLASGGALYPQFATHNAVTLAAILAMARTCGVGADGFEFQRLHGMGEALYRALGETVDDAPACRIYAPVGSQSQLLAYLIRRMLENGASTSFVRLLADRAVAPSEVVGHEMHWLPHLASERRGFPLPPALYGSQRVNARGHDLGDGATLARFVAAVAVLAAGGGEAAPASGDGSGGASGQAFAHASADASAQASAHASAQAAAHASPHASGTASAAAPTSIRSPADTSRIVGRVVEADPAAVTRAIDTAVAAWPAWSARPVASRADCLRRWADAIEASTEALVSRCVHEAGKTIADAIADVREAVDFCRYYAIEAERLMAEPQVLPGPTGERNELGLHGRGVFVCISPWNFPVAIYVGQVAAALVTGNAVLAKPAEQTPLVALDLARLAIAAGIPAEVLQVLPGRGEIVGAALTRDPRIAGVVFTGSNATAKAIQRALCEHHHTILPLIAETGGQNAMIVDSTALPEQVVDAVVQSAFRSAGQRCSALRVLALQNEVADPVLAMLRGALAALRVGDPCDPSTDVGPVIDAEARDRLEAHLARLAAAGRRIDRAPMTAEAARGTFVAPALVEIDSIGELTEEHFGPVLHVVRFDIARLDGLVDAINATGFGLTLGIQTRIDTRAEYIRRRARVGNVYVNRNMIGAVVGVQPFGGEGLSGTGPKAGGPHYLARFTVERTFTSNTAAAGGNLALLTQPAA